MYVSAPNLKGEIPDVLALSSITLASTIAHIVLINDKTYQNPGPAATYLSLHTNRDFVTAKGLELYVLRAIEDWGSGGGAEFLPLEVNI